MSFTMETESLDDCFDCPYIEGPVYTQSNQKTAFVCNKTNLIVTMYNKDADNLERCKQFELRHGGKDFPAWCPYMGKKNAVIEKCVTATFKPNKAGEESDLVDIFE